MLLTSINNTNNNIDIIFIYVFPLYYFFTLYIFLLFVLQILHSLSTAYSEFIYIIIICRIKGEMSKGINFLSHF